MIRGPKCAVRGRVVAGAGRGWQAVQRGRGWPSFHAFFFIGARTSDLGSRTLARPCHRRASGLELVVPKCFASVMAGDLRPKFLPRSVESLV